MDQHFQEKQKQKKNSRGWFVSAPQWRGDLLLPVAAKKEEEEPAQKKIKSSGPCEKCCVCFELLKCTWDDDEEEWVISEKVAMHASGKVAHVECI